MSPSEWYQSLWQQPLLLWISVLATTLWALTQPISASLRTFLLAGAAVSLLDAGLTAGDAGALLPLVFVILGDARYFLVLALDAPPRRWSDVPAKTWGRVLAASCIVPALSGLIARGLGGSAVDSRSMFLTYELLFLVLATALAWHPRFARHRAISLFVGCYYALWALSDTILLSGTGEWGYYLRTLANVMYYAGLIPFTAAVWNARHHAQAHPV